MTIKLSMHTLLSLNHGNINFDKIRERRESNPGPLREKHVCYPLRYAAPNRCSPFGLFPHLNEKAYKKLFAIAQAPTPLVVPLLTEPQCLRYFECKKCFFKKLLTPNLSSSGSIPMHNTMALNPGSRAGSGTLPSSS